MNEAQQLTPAREKHVRALSSISTQLHDHLMTFGETIRLRNAERRHAAESIDKVNDEINWLKRERQYASVYGAKSLEAELTKVKKEFALQCDREEALLVEIDQLKQQEKAARDAQQNVGNLVDAILRAFGPAGEDVSLRIKGQK